MMPEKYKISLVGCDCGIKKCRKGYGSDCGGVWRRVRLARLLLQFLHLRYLVKKLRSTYKTLPPVNFDGSCARLIEV
jgi:hypothetical protein